MPYFSFSITTEKGKTEANADRTPLLLSTGVIHHVDVRIPPGSEGLLHCKINHGLYQISPTRDGDWHGDDERVSYTEHYDLGGGPLELTAFTWNDDELFDHEIILGFGVLPRWVLLPFTIVNKVKNAVQALIGMEREV